VGTASARAFPCQPEGMSPPAAGRNGVGENIATEQETEIKTKREVRQPGEGGGPHCLALATALDGDPSDATP